MGAGATTALHCAVLPPAPASPIVPPSVKRLVPWLVAVAFFMESLDTTILNTAVPTIAAALRIAPLCFGFFSSFQYTSMNTLAYADIEDSDTSMASTIASTAQQLSMSFGVATASLATAFFVPDRFHAGSRELIAGIHHAFAALGALTIMSTLVFRNLRRNDGTAVSQQKVTFAEDHHAIAAEAESA